jgi:hypothetical protein
MEDYAFSFSIYQGTKSSVPFFAVRWIRSNGSGTES